MKAYYGEIAESKGIPPCLIVLIACHLTSDGLEACRVQDQIFRMRSSVRG